MESKTSLSSAEYISAAKLRGMFDPPLSLPTIRGLQKSRTIPFIRLGRRVLFSPAAVKKALDSTLTVRAKGGKAS